MISTLPEWLFPCSGILALIQRKCGSQSPDRWLKLSRNTQQEVVPQILYKKSIPTVLTSFHNCKVASSAMVYTYCIFLVVESPQSPQNVQSY